ncbi:MAG: hypothetical protein IPL59_15945 [Candidatus Competibacteraceae bacterium]|nr:hypothetical protein [Candidatus Competibacteraceae bacterium]
MDAAAVKDKTVRRGLITPERAETVGDHEAVQWIFAPRTVHRRMKCPIFPGAG